MASLSERVCHAKAPKSSSSYILKPRRQRNKRVGRAVGPIAASLRPDSSAPSRPSGKSPPRALASALTPAGISEMAPEALASRSNQASSSWRQPSAIASQRRRSDPLSALAASNWRVEHLYAEHAASSARAGCGQRLAPITAGGNGEAAGVAKRTQKSEWPSCEAHQAPEGIVKIASSSISYRRRDNRHRGWPAAA